MQNYCVHVNFFGRVQGGVGFRFLCLRKANSFGIKEWVKNDLDHDLVEAIFCGEKSKVLLLIEEMKHGAYWIRVDNVVIEEMNPSQDYKNFEVRC